MVEAAKNYEQKGRGEQGRRIVNLARCNLRLFPVISLNYALTKANLIKFNSKTVKSLIQKRRQFLPTSHQQYQTADI